VFDSGVGQAFGLSNVCQEFFLPGQPTRYARATNYSVTGTGLSPYAMAALQAFVTPKPIKTYYPLASDTKYFNVNLARRPDALQPNASAVYANGAIPYTQVPSWGMPANAVDGVSRGFVWAATSGNLATATATLTVDLGQVQSLGGIRVIYHNAPLSSTLRLAPTASGPWTTVLNDVPVTINDFSPSFDAVSARYVELTMKGAPIGIADVVELVPYPSAASNPGPSSAEHLDLTYLTATSMSINANMGQGGGFRVHAPAPNFTGYYVKTAAQGGTGDATTTLDLGQAYSISEVGLAFYSKNWPSGGKVEVDDGAGNWSTVYDSGRGNAFGTVDSVQRIPFATRSARNVRITGYFPPAASSGYLDNIEVF